VHPADVVRRPCPGWRRRAGARSRGRCRRGRTARPAPRWPPWPARTAVAGRSSRPGPRTESRVVPRPVTPPFPARTSRSSTSRTERCAAASPSRGPVQPGVPGRRVVAELPRPARSPPNPGTGIRCASNGSGAGPNSTTTGSPGSRWSRIAIEIGPPCGAPVASGTQAAQVDPVAVVAPVPADVLVQVGQRGRCPWPVPAAAWCPPIRPRQNTASATSVTRSSTVPSSSIRVGADPVAAVAVHPDAGHPVQRRDGQPTHRARRRRGSCGPRVAGARCSPRRSTRRRSPRAPRARPARPRTTSQSRASAPARPAARRGGPGPGTGGCPGSWGWASTSSGMGAMPTIRAARG